MSPPTPSLTKEWRKDTYPSISPSRPELSAEGKTIVITGGGAGIGREIAKAFATAKAKHIALISRTEHKLLSLKEEIEGSHAGITSVSAHAADVADEQSMLKAATEIGGWDVLIINAGLMNRETTIMKDKIGDWWRVFEASPKPNQTTNVKGAVVTAQAFLPHHKPGAAMIGINAAMINLPASSPFATGSSSYIASKIAQVKVMEHIAAEHPDVFVASVHPGVVDTNMVQGINLGETLDKAWYDNVHLPADYMVWITSREGKFLRDKWVSVNWDVDELKTKAKEIQGNEQFLQANILGWPFQAF
ncbi:MAG: hypothetical protein Q9220_005990 [cf. Caloplaca sp. 1 TL-2023]